MSYILDALRRAEAERNAMQAPDLNRLGTVGAAPTVDMAPSHRPRRRWAILGLALVAVAVLVTFLALSRRESTAALPRLATPMQVPAAQRAEAPPPVEMAAPPGASAPLVETPSLVLPRSPLIERERASRPSAADTAASRMPITAATAPAPASSSGAAASGAANRPSSSATTSSAVPSQPRSPVAPAPPTPLPSGSQPAAIPSRDELPPDVRRTLPPFSIGGTVYSPDPLRRMLIVDGELWREGDQIRPDIVIEQIRPRDAVLRYRGLRFSVAP